MAAMDALDQLLAQPAAIVGRMFAMARQALSRSQDEMAKQAKLSQTMVSRIEAGDETVTTKKREALGRALAAAGAAFGLHRKVRLVPNLGFPVPVVLHSNGGQTPLNHWHWCIYYQNPAAVMVPENEAAVLIAEGSFTELTLEDDPQSWVIA
jgi:transcriptional regulator with XRE-family HTH domain